MQEYRINEMDIPKQKVKDKIKKHKFVKEAFEKEYDNKNYEDNGYNHLDGQEHNKAFNSAEIQAILNSGFNTVADCFIEYDAKHYQIDDNFMKVLRYIQRNNLYNKKGDK